MELILKVTPEEYNLIHKGLSKLSIEEALPTLNKIVAEIQSQINSPKEENEKCQ